MSKQKPALALATLIAIVSAFAASAESPGESSKLALIRLTDRLYVSVDTYYAQENSIVYIGDSSVTVVGATWTPHTARLLAAEIAKITAKPISEAIDTNHDLDRAGGNAYFKSIGARIVSTRLTKELLAREGKRQAEDTRRAFRDFPEFDIVLPDQVYEGDFALQGGRVRGIYLGPSHKADDIFVYFPNEKVLYGGCILKERLGSTEGADLVEYPKTLRKLKGLNLDISTVVAGHFSPLHGPELIDRYLKLLEQGER
jgi:metallo-beta-lactamase class B